MLCRVRNLLCALPLEHVVETMRALPVEPMAGLPAFVRGLAVVRGTPTPVLDASALLCGERAPPVRFVTIRTGQRHVVLAVDAVIGVVELPPETARTLPPLFQHAGPDALSAVGALDGALLLVLESARLVPDDVWAAIDRGGAPA